MKKLALYVDFARPFTLLPPLLGIISGAVCAWGSAHNPYAHFTLGLALTLVTYQVYPMITAGKPINTVPPAIIVSFEGGMLAALIATLVFGFRSIGLGPFRSGRKVFDRRIHEGRIALCARVDTGDQERLAIEAMNASGGEAVRAEEGEL